MSISMFGVLIVCESYIFVTFVDYLELPILLDENNINKKSIKSRVVYLFKGLFYYFIS